MTVLGPSAAAYERRAYRGYVLALLTAANALNLLDRQLVVILQEPIKRELALSDTQLGLLSGFGFSAVYVVCGVAVALWSESRARRSVVALAIATWSLMAACCGLAGSYAQLLLARMGVAVGESGGNPPSHSMISDIYPPERRASALAVHATGVNLGILFGFLLGGWINHFFGWRVAFLALGLPGVLLAVLVRFTVAEPLRGRFDATGSLPQATPRLGTVLRELWAKRSFRWLALGAGFQAFGLYGIGSWFPSYLIRSFGLGTGEVGTWLALISGGAGTLGALTGGWLGDRLARRDPRWYLWLPLICVLVSLPFTLAVLLAANAPLALLLHVVPVLMTNVYLAPIIAVAHGLVGPRIRATTSAVLFFVLNLIGMGAGPLFVGVLSDALWPELGAQAMRVALASTALLASAGCALTYALAAWCLPRDLAVRG